MMSQEQSSEAAAAPASSGGWPAGQRFVQAPPALTGAPGLHKVGANPLGSGEAVPVSEAEAMQWNAQDWKFDPYALRAFPASQDGKALGGKQQVSTGGVDPPPNSSVTAAQQPAKLPSLAMSTGSRSKGHPTCQVATCETDLTPLKEYHQRYKICEFHLKVHSIVREGKRQRFCQQCGRFHDLSEFDGDKRSCRARLQRHNARRRKKTEADASKPSSVSKKPAPAAKRIEKRPADSEGRPYHDGHSGNEAMELDDYSGLLPEGVRRTDSENMQDGSGESSGPGPSELYSRRPRSLPAPLFEDSLHNGLLESQASVYSSRGPPSYLLQSDRHLGAAPFPARTGAPAQSSTDYLARAAPSMSQGGPALLAGLGEPGFSRTRPMDLGFGAGPRGAHVTVPHEALLPHFTMAETPASIMNEARRIMQAPADNYISDEQLTRVSAKLFNCTPANLPLDMKQNLIHLLGRGINSMEGYIRPGCVHVTLNAVTDVHPDAQDAGLDIRSVIERMQETDASLLNTDRLLIQVNDEIALVKNRQVQHVLSCSGSHAVFPLIARVSSQVQCSNSRPSVQLFGCNIGHSHNVYLCRCQGTWVTPQIVHGTAPGEGEVSDPFVELRFEQGMRNGLIHVEVMRGGMVSAAKPVMILDNQNACEELRYLQQEMSGTEFDALLHDCDRLLEVRNAATALVQQSGECTRVYSDEDMEHAGRLAVKLLRFVVQRGCVGLAGYVFPIAFKPPQAADVQPRPGALSLLHLAVRSGSLRMVAALLEWGSLARTEFHAGAAGPNGLTPLHLAALYEENGRLSGSMVKLLAELCEDGAVAWTTAHASGGTPASLAAAAGNTAALEAVARLAEAREADQAADFADEGWPVNSATGDVLTLDAAVAAGMPPGLAGASASLEGFASEDDLDSEDELDEAGSEEEQEEEEAIKEPISLPAVACVMADASSDTPQQQPYDLSDTAASVTLNSTKEGLTYRGGQHCPTSVDGTQWSPDTKPSAATCSFKSNALGLKQKDQEPYMGHSVDGMHVSPTVFGHFEALISAVFIATIGAATLSVRWYFEYLCEDSAL